MMKTKTILHHLKGEQAYLIYWRQYYQSKPRLSTIKAIDTNLEIITDAEQNRMAYRHDYPDDMMPITSKFG